MSDVTPFSPTDDQIDEAAFLAAFVAVFGEDDEAADEDDTDTSGLVVEGQVTG